MTTETDGLTCSSRDGRETPLTITLLLSRIYFKANPTKARPGNEVVTARPMRHNSFFFLDIRKLFRLCSEKLKNKI